MEMSERGLARDRVVVVGAGLTGLAAAHRLVTRASATSRRPVEVIVLDAKDRIGGAIWTKSGRWLYPRRGGRLVHHQQALGARPLLGTRVSGDQLIGTDDRHRRSFVVRKDGKLLPVPEGFVLMAPEPARAAADLADPLGSVARLRMLLDLVIPRKTDDDDESLASFVRRRDSAARPSTAWFSLWWVGSTPPTRTS